MSFSIYILSETSHVRGTPLKQYGIIVLKMWYICVWVCLNNDQYIYLRFIGGAANTTLVAIFAKGDKSKR